MVQPLIHQPNNNRERIGSNMSILMLCWEYPPNLVGGLARHAYELSIHLANMGHDVHIVTAGRGDLSLTETVNGVRIHRVRPLNEHDDLFLNWIGGLNLAMAFKAETLAAEIPFQFIHAHDWLVGAAAITLKDMLSIPLLSTIHATEHGRNNGIDSHIQQFIHSQEEQLISESDQVIVCSNAMRDHLTSVFLCPNQKIHIIPNGVSQPKVRLKTETDTRKTERKSILSIGRIVREKGFETIIEAAAKSKERNLNYFFRVAGKGPVLETYRRITIERELTNYVEFVGEINEEQRNTLIEQCDRFVVPSLYEPFGIVALEAMIHGKPTIVTDTGGLKEIVTHLNTGLIMKPGDSEELLEQLERLDEFPRLANEIANNGLDLVCHTYRWDQIAYETGNVMGNLVSAMKSG